MTRLRKTSNKATKPSIKNETLDQNIEENPKNESTLWKKVITRLLLSFLMMFAVYWTSTSGAEKSLASQDELVKHRTIEVLCSKAYQKEISKFKGCVPKKCGRLVTDIIISESEAAHLLQIAKKGMAFGGSNGGASVLDLHSGALSQGSSFINLYKKMKDLGSDKIFTEQDFAVYKNVRLKIQQMVAFNFGLDVAKLHLTHPTFFSEITSKSAKTIHDEYWHVHVDKETYPSFHYTSLLYLSDYGEDFKGGRFVFVDVSVGRNMTVEPRIGRVSAFTSGAENPHYVERVSSGVRYALTVSFTCDKKSAIGDPSLSKMQ